MRLKVLSNRTEIIQQTVQKLIEKINNKERFVLGLSTGATVLSICEELATAVQDKKVSLKNVVIFYAGEFVGYSKSSHYFERLNQVFLSKVDIQPENVHTFDGTTKDLDVECRHYEQKIIQEGGIDLFLGSLGEGGELAFNEPGSSLKSRTRLKTLSLETIKADARFFDNDPSKVPTQALTIGIDNIFEAREVIIVVYGINKAFAIQSCLEKPISEMQPASILQMHQNTTFFVDKVAGRLLSNTLPRNF